MTKKKLKKILSKHKVWVESGGKKGTHADLSYTNLHGADLHDADLRYADLRGADLSFADLCYTNLQNANLHDADLGHADLNFADLSHADLGRADLRYADLSDAVLNDTNLDFSCFPLWCGGLEVGIDDRIVTQLLYHTVSNALCSPNVSNEIKEILSDDKIINLANRFHRVNEYECKELKGVN